MKAVFEKLKTMETAFANALLPAYSRLQVHTALKVRYPYMSQVKRPMQPQMISVCDLVEVGCDNPSSSDIYCIVDWGYVMTSDGRGLYSSLCDCFLTIISVVWLLPPRLVPP